ncbi:hypothetical protein SISSUDRAFT_241886 [Sistotremastrum suecicum HHB10207 ss-3]|uniref:Uncharacterized protein n=1 Tax=Sistotremastrum suecicum HHB10207 ss-3 TaxID=1314776 RepID=A0A166A0N5_9AGAM|nr:hypothetical protein SISSUDRAFT_241886 [Sistotremastrum suecicum HHB10207 ss-3]
MCKRDSIDRSLRVTVMIDDVANENWPSPIPRILRECTHLTILISTAHPPKPSLLLENPHLTHLALLLEYPANAMHWKKVCNRVEAYLKELIEIRGLEMIVVIIPDVRSSDKDSHSAQILSLLAPQGNERHPQRFEALGPNIAQIRGLCDQNGIRLRWRLAAKGGESLWDRGKARLRTRRHVSE